MRCECGAEMREVSAVQGWPRGYVCENDGRFVPYEPSWKELQFKAEAEAWAGIVLKTPNNPELIKYVVNLAEYANELARLYFP